MVVKINVSIAEDILKQIDEAAREAGTSRSAFLVRAAKHYLEESEEERRREQRRWAGREIDRIREQAPPWDATAEVLKWRDLH
ncbi:MAG: hypothetical protein A2147_09750 [Chloroflexi bacterium RBG_16_57_8]|nr:MAG: hypothetical protein A2147_09750 [Chloroflexi bacterium RBG_16_57_8]